MYNIHNTNVINELTALTGSKETAVNIYTQAMYLYETTRNEIFHVRLVNKEWSMVVDDFAPIMSKHLLNENEHD